MMKSSTGRSNIHDSEITSTVNVEGTLSGLSIGTFQEDYPLTEADFMRLTSERSSISAWALNIFFATIGYVFSIMPKLLSWLRSASGPPSSDDWWPAIAGIFLSFVFFLASRFWLGEKAKLLRKMKDHFKTAPRTRRALEREQQ